MHWNETAICPTHRGEEQRTERELYGAEEAEPGRKSDWRDRLRREFYEKEKRHAHAKKALNAWIATQIKTLREQRKLSQRQLAELAGMTQPRIAVLEDVDYSSWSINSLRRLAEAFDLRLSVKFESFSSLIPELEDFNIEQLKRPSFAEDFWFKAEANTSPYAVNGAEKDNQKARPVSISESMYRTTERARNTVAAAIDKR